MKSDKFYEKYPMKKIRLFKKFVLIVITISIGIASSSYAQENDDTILEKVKVVNVEVPVRVVYKGKPVDNLKKSDFKIYEDGKLQKINAFFNIRKKINIQNYELSAEKREKTVYPSRYFVLIFNLIDYNRDLKIGLDYTFNNILKENDQLLVIVNNKNLYFNDLSKKEKILKQITKLLEEKGKITKNKLIELFNEIDRKIRVLKILSSERESESSKDTNVFMKFLDRYYFIWQHFKRDYLRQDIDNYYFFAKHLEKIREEKWVIHFHQEIQFPQIKLTSSFLTGSIREKEKIILDRILDRINFELKAATKFPADEVSKLFYKVNATFHMILIPTRIYIPHEDMEFKSVSTALENCFREITKKTGGTLVSSADLVTALNTISEKEDIYYMLTYRPEKPEKIGKIRVEVLDNKHHYKVRYDKNLRSNYIKKYLDRKKSENPEIKIKQIAFQNQILSLFIGDYLLKRLKKKISGQVDLWVRIENNDGEILYDKHKKLNPANKTASIQIDFNWLKQGRYYFFVEAHDELTEKSYQEYIQAEINEIKTKIKRVDIKQEDILKPENQSEEDQVFKNRELEKYLKGAAEYCKKLTENAFHFICKEKVTISFKIIAPDKKIRSPYVKLYRQSTERYLFDYQMLYQRNQIKEYRKLMSKVSGRDKKLSVKNLVYSFLSERPVFGPRTLLSKDRQHMFRYEIVKTINNKDQRLVIIEVIPKKSEEVFFSSGKVWIDTDNFSVRKIQVTPRYIQGYENLLRIAKVFQARLNMDCQIEYDKEYKGLYFPTEVIIIERYKGGMSIVREFGSKGWERTRTLFTYQDYKFFNVNTDIQYE